MERTEKDSDSAVGAPHSFPAFVPASKTKDRDDNCFRPLFQTPACRFKDTKDSPGDGSEDGSENNALAVALKESYDRGAEKGIQEACDLAQQELAPSLQRFSNRLNAFSDDFKPFTQDQAAQIVALALSIAGKVSGCRRLRHADDLLPVQNALDAGLQGCHQLNLQLNKDDLKALADTARCQNLELNQSCAVRFSQNDVIQRGAPQSSSPSLTVEALGIQMTQSIEDLP